MTRSLLNPVTLIAIASVLQACAVVPVAAIVHRSNDPRPGFVSGSPGMSGGAFGMNRRTLLLPGDALQSRGVKLDRAISNMPGVSESQREKVLTAIDALSEYTCEVFLWQHDREDCPVRIRLDAFVFPATHLPIMNR